jgi:hypothetical protein
MSGKAIIEEAYDVVLSNKSSYYQQMKQLEPSGILGNVGLLTHVVFLLCELVDEQAKEIEKLKHGSSTL